MTAEFSDQSMSQTFSVASPGRLARKSSMGFNTTMLDEHLSARPKSREQLTPMPTYMEPITKSAGRCWAKLHEDHMLLKLRKRKTLKSEQNHKIRDDAIRSVKRLPTEVLVMDWMKEQLQTLEPRVFLIENLLPTLILGLEKLLVEVEKRDVGELTTLDFRFNPINFLAQYLMRNNPRYSNFSEASPYIHGLRLISEEMKKQLFDYDSNSLSVMKIQARRRRKQREAQRSQLHAEKKRRMMALINQYEEWSEGLLTGGHIDLALIQNTLRSFFEITEQYPQELRQVTSKMAELLEPTDDTDTSLSVREYTSYMKKFIIDIPSEIFDHLLTHLSQCAREYKVKVEREHRRTKLAQLFSFCDHTGVGLVDRHRILNLFEIFYDKAKDDIRNALRNPRKWPVLEVTEVDSEDGGPDEEEQDPKFFDNNRDVTEETKESNPGNLVEISAPDEENVEEKDLPNGDDPVVLRTHAVKALPASEGEGAVDGEKGEVEKGKAEGKTAEESKADAEPKETDAAEKTEKEQEDVEARKEEVKTGEVKEGEVKEGEVKTEEVKEGEVKEEEVKADEVKEGEVKEEEVKKEEVTEEEKKEEEKKEGEKKEEEKPSVEEANSQEAHQPEVKPTEDVKVILTPEGADEEQAAETEEGKAVSGSDEKPPLTQQSRVSFAEGTTFEKGERALLTSHGSRSQSQASAFDENTLNESQFVQLTETFLCDDPDYEEMFTKLVGFVKDGYMETEEERMKRLIKARQDLKSAKQKALLNSLFEMWDNDGSGVLDIEEIEATMKKYKDGMEVEAITKARKEIKKKIKLHQDSRINKREFRELVFRVISMMPGMDEFDYFVDFLLSNVERSYAERVRGEARKKWLQQIVNAAEMSAARMEPVYKILFKALFKDAEAHGGSKVISGYIALLEKNDVAPKRGGFMLRYVASTPSDAVYLLGRALFPDMKGISFACVEAAKPIHVPKVANHGNIHFWNIDRIAEERNGSFIVIPLKDRNKRVFGILGIDTMNDPHSRALFITHEIQFFQGVAKAFSIAYHHVDVRQKTMRISESAISWIRRRSPHVIQVTVYMVEPDGRNQDFVLRKMMDTNLRGVAAPQKNPPRLERKDNLFRDYLFKCVDNSETISADAYGERHLAVPLRDYDGWAIVVVDISIIDVKELPHIESREVMKMLKLLQMAYKEIFREAIEGEKKYMLEGERESDNNRTGIMFDRLMLMELRDNVSKLDATAYAELKSYKEPPEVVHLILKSVLAIFHHKLAVEGYFDNWNQCKQYVKPQLNQMIINYDPTAVEPIKDPVPLELINSYLDDVPHGTVAKHGSMPAQFLYNWVFVCVSLIEHSRKMRAGRPRVITEEIAARKRTKVLEGMASADVEDAKEEEEEEKKGDDKEAESEGEGEDESKQKSEEGSLKDNAKDDHPSLESGKNKDVKKSPSGGAKESTSGESNEDSSDNSESDEGSESDEIDDSD